MVLTRRLERIKRWRLKQRVAGQPHSLMDYYRAHNICQACRRKPCRCPARLRG